MLNQQIGLLCITGSLHINSAGNVVPAKEYRDVPCKCRPNCQVTLTQQEKEDIFRSFYSLATHTEQNLYLRGCVSFPSGQRLHNEYYVNTGGRSQRICLKYFLSLHGIALSRLRKKVSIFIEVFVFVACSITKCY